VGCSPAEPTYVSASNCKIQYIKLYLQLAKFSSHIHVPSSVTVGHEIGWSSAITFEPAARLISKVMIVFFITSYLMVKKFCYNVYSG
jgi:hypothetical protein